MYRLVVSTVLLCLLPSRAALGGQIEPQGAITPETYICYHTTQPVQVDGKLDVPCWQDAPWTAYFVDIEGDLKPRPRFKTRAKMLWDDDYLYVAADMEEPDVWATLTQRDDIISFPLPCPAAIPTSCVRFSTRPTPTAALTGPKFGMLNWTDCWTEACRR